ncbi:MAG TPA: amino acid adenylation domain-containing protein [Thermoanaerobaculia bacterium]|nr:amino acid adenylation domain-containing protein [Thermoanaerobaculia bacterium]
MPLEGLEGFRLSPQQERLWRLAGTAERAAAVRIAIEGPLDTEALDAALAAAVERNELLRTDFRLLPGLTAPLQVVTEEPSPFLRWSLVQLAPERHELRLDLSALLADAAGLDNLAAEIARGYGGQHIEPVQYIDLSEWQHELLESEETRQGREYWSRQPAVPPAPVLPWTRPGGTWTPRRVAVSLPGATPRSVLLAAWQALLWRLGGRPEALAVAVTFPGRKLADLRDALGLFARDLPVVMRWEPGLRLRDVAARLDRLEAGHAEWQEFFVPAGEALQYAFEYREAPRRHAAGDVVFTAVERNIDAESSLARLIAEEGSLEILYDASRLPDAAAELLAARLEALLAGADSDIPVEELEIVSAAERRLLESWNDTAAGLGPETLVHCLVEAQAARTPAAAAVESDGGRLTYAELDRRAGSLARRLRRLGVGPEVRVAVCLDRSLDLPVALLGVWKAGGAYVPLDPSYPLDRLTWVLDDARPAVLVTGPGAPAGLARPGMAVLDLSEEAEPLPPLVADAAASPDQLAYVIYTSGSTGRPKGVMVPHRAIANRLLWMQSVFPVGENDAVLQKTPFGFDASLWELFLPLLAGARLVLARPGGHQDPAYLARTVAERGITVLQLVPSLLGPFLDAEESAGRGLARLFCGGEALAPALRDRAFARLAADLCNLYGPTECAIDVTFWPCRRDDPRPTVPIGRPIANLRVHLLDGQLQPVPAGLPGELYAAGVGVGRGYLGRPDLTAERFLPDPFAAGPGGRMYRTGDLARQEADGALEFLGRADDQVKLRGVRIELGEIEGCLVEHPAVAEAVAAVRSSAEGGAGLEGPRLVAYVVPRGEAPASAELRAALAARLPESMVPSAFVRLSALPRLPNGKVDRAALPAPGPEGEEGDHAAPRTPTEQILSQIWAELLGVDSLGRHDNVFALGWHSLLATQFASRLRRTFGVSLPLRSLFDHLTVASLGERIDAALRGGEGREAPPVGKTPRDRPLPLSFAQRRLWFLDRWQPGSPFYNIPVALRFNGPLDVAVLGRSLSEVARRHESLRTRFAEQGDEPVQVIDPPRPMVLPVADLSGLPGAEKEAELRRFVTAEALRPFDLARGPLLRAALVRLAGAEHVGLLTLHHVISDGWSTGVLVRELGALYGALAAGRRVSLLEPPVQYADFAAWQREWLQGEVLESHVSWWRRQLDGAPPRLELRSDRPRPEAQTFRGGTRARLLPAETVDAVKALARSEGVTLFMAMLAAGAVLLGWAGGTDDLVVGTDVAGRDRGETEGLIGFFINQLPLRARLTGDPTFRELLGRVREATLGAYAHQDLPFDKLVEVLNPERSRQHSPLFQVKINLLNVPPPVLELPGLTLEPLAAPRETSQFDWILNLGETDQGFGAWVEYSTDLFDAATIERMLGGYEELLAAAAERPAARVSELIEVLEAADERQRAAAVAERQQARHQSLKMARRQAVAPAVAGEGAL